MERAPAMFRARRELAWPRRHVDPGAPQSGGGAPKKGDLEPSLLRAVSTWPLSRRLWHQGLRDHRRRRPGDRLRPWRPVRLMNSPWPRIWSIACRISRTGCWRQRLCFARVPPISSSGTRAPGRRSRPRKTNRPWPAPGGSTTIATASSACGRASRNTARRRNPLRENRQILHGRALPCRHLRLDQERLQAITGPSGPPVCEERRISSFCPTGHVRYPTLSPAGQAVRTDAEISTAVR